MQVNQKQASTYNLVIFFHLIGNMGRVKNKEKFRHGKKKKIYSKEIQMKMKELKQQGKSREKACEILKVPLVDIRSWQRYVNPKNQVDEQGSATCTFNRPFNFIRDPVRVQFETEVIQMFRERSKSRGFPKTMLELCCREVMKKQNFQNDETV